MNHQHVSEVVDNCEMMLPVFRTNMLMLALNMEAEVHAAHLCLLLAPAGSLSQALEAWPFFSFLHVCHSCGHCGDVSLLRMDTPAQKRSYYIYILLHRHWPCQLCAG